MKTFLKFFLGAMFVLFFIFALSTVFLQEMDWFAENWILVLVVLVLISLNFSILALTSVKCLNAEKDSLNLGNLSASEIIEVGISRNDPLVWKKIKKEISDQSRHSKAEMVAVLYFINKN